MNNIINDRHCPGEVNHRYDQIMPEKMPTRLEYTAKADRRNH